MQQNIPSNRFTWAELLLFPALVLGSVGAHSAEPGPDLRQVQIRAQINPALPDYNFFLTKDTVYISSEYLNARQTVKTKGDPPSDPAHYFVLHDINFDGYLDLATWEFGGAKWGISHYLVFDKKSGHFVSNWLTRKLDQFKHNGIRPDARSKEIRVDHLVTSEGLASETYRLQKDRLVLVETEEKHYDSESQTVTTVTKRLVDGKMKVIKKESQ